jgi:hypothetical protein
LKAVTMQSFPLKTRSYKRSSKRFGQHRTLEQDVEFAFAQLSEIAIRALSPALNDTYTGLSSIDWLGDALRMLAAFSASDGAWRTGDGKVRLLFDFRPHDRGRFVPALPTSAEPGTTTKRGAGKLGKRNLHRFGRKGD